MTNELVFATNNKHKIEEISSLLGNSIKLLSLADIGCFDEIPEDQNTLEGNAMQKARYIYNKFHRDCFADDTGLEVEGLNGRPGVYSARYSENETPNVSNEKRSEANIKKLTREMKPVKNKKAAFRTIICLIIKGNEYLFEGKVNGRLISEMLGKKGFGYDPIFIPSGYNITYAEMSLEEKNQISHRAKAIRMLIEFLNKNC
jgi:XTP/dITP diphosphohydrolase